MIDFIIGAIRFLFVVFFLAFIGYLLLQFLLALWRWLR